MGPRSIPRRAIWATIPSSSGAATVDHTGSQWNIAGQLYVGNAGHGSLSVQNGGAVTSNGICYVSYNASQAAGTVTVDGGGSTWTNNGNVVLGSGGAGNGFLNITNGGLVTVMGAILDLGRRGNDLLRPNQRRNPQHLGADR